MLPALHHWPAVSLTPRYLGRAPPLFVVDPPDFLDALHVIIVPMKDSKSALQRLLKRSCMAEGLTIFAERDCWQREVLYLHDDTVSIK